MRNDDVKKVMIYRLGSLGDTLVALPALHLVARAFPNAERRMLTNIPVHSKAPAAAAVLGDSGIIDSYQNYPVGLRNAKALLSLRREIRRWHPEVLVYLTVARGRKAALRDNLFFRWCGIRRLVGVPSTMELQANLWLPSMQALEPEAQRLARCIAELGDARLDDPLSWDMRLTEAEHAAAASRLRPLDGLPLIMVSVGTKVQAKDWGADNWKALLGRMATAYPGHGLALLGAAEERGLSEEAGAMWSAASTLAGPVVNLCGELTPRESAAAISRAKVFLGHDSGPMHLASCVQTPCVAIFAARNKPAVWFPYGKRNEVIYHKTDCWGCDLDTCILQKKKCIASISVDEVVERLAKLLPAVLEIQPASR
ncbi:MAG: glycosyltransferase family 9 protein [Acidobacteriaceae bacterium]